MPSPELSIVIVFHDMVREAPRTLFSLSPNYQTGISGVDYEVIAIDNGSSRPLDEAMVKRFGENFRYHFFETDSPSPAHAVNFGVEVAQGRQIALVVDGARMATPGLVGTSLIASRGSADPFVGALAWHLGPKVQWDAAAEGYNQSEEDRLLNSIDWQNNGYRLFEISTIAPSSHVGFLGGMPAEFSWLVMLRNSFLDMGGYDTRFRSPGGGLMNHEFVGRITARLGDEIVILLGEGTFHQIHGGITTSSKPGQHPIKDFRSEYREIFGTDYHVPGENLLPAYFGRLPREARRFIARYGN